ncbi:mitogen-activated protein kinase kinase kinase 17-like [Tripterygium wilfordii]|uniref:mitogen-activated protein kinase kinase kinase 17-like n=1 Tax=Tripterygium wilfordii TaxID=458696 RepID=UPI0018F7E877|nr:mitogen-activated protein kinase kinase kinase 17-like [Tripterygium wilfordii]
METHGAQWVRGPMIGRGAFGSVYLAYSKKSYCYLPPAMAVKSTEVSDSASLQKEVEVLNNLQGSPYVIGCFGEETTTGANGEMVYNVLLEYASGGSLDTLIKKSSGVCRGLPELDVRRYARHLLLGIAHIHESGYVHCDLKPDNVLLVPYRNSMTKFVTKIGDFGLAKRGGQSKKAKFDNYLRGTAPYLAPEVVINHVQEAPADIWALGCVVLEMLTGESPWGSDSKLTAEELFNKIADTGALPQTPPGISNEAKDFLKRCLVRNPMFRFTADMLLDHPFFKGCEDEYEAVEEDVGEVGQVIGVGSSCWPEDSFSSLLVAEDWCSVSDEDSDSLSCSGSEDLKVYESAAEQLIPIGHKRKRSSHFIPITDGDFFLTTLAPTATITAGI